ncbi:leukotoxin LktA family filamentous adhesin [Rhizobium sp. RU36D]|uniref:leukotoxin LktA family filamentous adhesin n=1 Tax=Rhizobium sp. RU36D TaxID=1907415 RepID=UPI0015C46A7C|nr:leukotoxin LktA family filamentous adhesin [Rhizobium sp. RU36D]
MLKQWSRGLRHGVALLPFATATTAMGQSMDPAPNVIIPDGRTATGVADNGGATDVTTDTLAGGNAYNSFSRFEVGENNTVNLHVPTNAGHLINIVRDAPVVVDGTLNAMKDGRIGGNVVFADPYGFIVNRNGVVNAGSLTVNTPTREFLEQTIDSSGRIDTLLGARIIEGDVPLSPDGAIVIRGKVNTESGVFLKANSVDVDGPERHRAQFEATVNTSGHRSGGQIVVRNGKLKIVAAGSARVGGTLRAGGGSRGGDIEIKAGANVQVLPTARIEALRANDAETLTSAFAAVRAASAGKVSITAAGTLSLAGAVVAEGSVHTGGHVAIAGNGVDIENGAAIVATTEAAGASSLQPLSVAKVEISSSADLKLSGRVSADGADGRSGGAIDVHAAQDIALASTSELSANGIGGAGGRIIVFADRNLSVADGTTVKARAGLTGDGGFVELSAKKVVDLATVNLDLGSSSGRAGTLFIDPEDLIIGGFSPSIFTNGADYSALASNSITIRSGFGIDTRMLTGGVTSGNSGNVTLTAPNITIENGGYINTSVTAGSTYQAGDVSLIAHQIDTDNNWGAAGVTDHFSSSITVNGTITARNITLSSLAEYEVNSLHAGTTSTIGINGTLSGSQISVLSRSIARSNYNDTGWAFGVLNGAISAVNPLGLDAAWVSASSVAHLNVGMNANISGSAVKLESLAIGEAVDSKVGLSGSSHLSVSVVVGMVKTDARTNVAQGATITTSESLGVGAVTDTRLNVLSSVVSGLPFAGLTGGAQAVGAVAYGSADVDANAVIESNANIRGNGSVTVLARSDSSFSVNAKGYGTGQTAAGGTLAISEINSNTVARLGSSVNNTGASGRDVTVQAISNVKANDTTAGITVGSGTVADVVSTIGVAGNLLGGGTLDLQGVTNLIYSKFMASPAGMVGSNIGVKGAASLSLSHGSITADASIARNATGGLNPSIQASGNVSVVSDVINKKIVSNSVAGINSTAKDPTSASTSATVGAAAAVAIYDVDHYSRAYLGSDVQVTARHVGVNAYSSAPVGIFISDWDNAKQVFFDVYRAVVANPGIFTSGAKATAESDQLSLAGSYNHFNLGMNTLAWIGSGARVTSTATDNTWSVDKLDAIGVVQTDGSDQVRFTFQTGVDVLASTDVETLSVVGNWGLTGNASQTTAVGGSASALMFDISTIAGIADSASVTSASDLAVDATSRNFLISVTPSSGSGGSIAGSGMVSVFDVDSQTHASISNTANVTADALSVTAGEDLAIYSATGQLQHGTGATLGISAAIVDIGTDTAAYIGDNFGAAGSVVGTQLRAASGTRGVILADELAVRALTKGTVMAAAISAAASQPTPATAPPAGTPSKALELLLGSQPAQAPKFNLAVVGSASVIINALDTRAEVSGVNVTRRNAANTAASMRVEAINTSHLYSLAGGAALTATGPNSSGTAGVAGSIAIGGSANKTIATVSNTNVTDIANVAVQGLTGGSYTVSAVGMSLAAGSSDLLSIAGSVSVTEITDSVQGLIQDSSFVGSGTGSLAATAYRKTDVAIGAGTIALGGKVGAGFAVTYVAIKDGAGGYATQASISNSAIRGYIDVSAVAAAPSRIYTGVASSAVTTGSLALSGALIITDIGGTVLASIDGSHDDDDIIASRHVNVKSGTADADDLNALLSAATRGVNTAAVDYSEITYENAENGAVTEIAAGAAIVAMAGNISGGTGGASAGASIISNYVHQRHIARIDGVDVTAGGNVTVAATDATSILALGMGVGVSTGGFAGQAAAVDNRVNSSISANVGGGSRATTVAAAELAVTAQDAVVIRGAATSAAVASGLAGGIGIAVNSVGMNVDAKVANAAIDTSGSVKVRARSTADILTVAAGVAAGTNAGLAGSAASSKIDTNVRALVLSGSDIDAANNVIIDASNSGRISVIAGALGVGMSGAGVGLSIVVNQIDGDTEARIADSTLDADGAGADDVVQAGALAQALEPGDVQDMGFSTPDFTRSTRSVSGVAVLANSTQTVTGVAVTVGLAGAGPAAAILPVTTLAGGRTIAAIDQSTVGTRVGVSSDILVSASSHSYSGNLALSGAGSATASAGAAASVATTMKRATEARIAGSTIGAAVNLVTRPRNVTVEAVASQSASDIAIGFAAGLIGGGAGSAIFTVFNADTEASIEGGHIRATSANVSADSTNGYFAAAGAGAGGLFGGYAGAAVVGVSKNTTVARIGDTGVTTRLDLEGDLNVSSASHNAFTANAYGVAGSVVGGPIAGLAVVTVVANDTQALLRDATITIASNAMVGNRAAGITLSAHEDLETKTATGAGAITFVGTGLGAAANVVVLTSKVQADSSGGSISAPGLFDISATTEKTVDAKTVAIGGGAVSGIGAAVGVVIAGGSAAADAMAELNKNGEGTLASINELSAAGGDFVLAGDEIANWRGRAASELGVSNPTDMQVQAWARQRYVALLQAGSFTNNGTYIPDPALTPTDHAQARAQAIADWNSLSGGRATYVLADDQLLSYSQNALTGNDRTAFAALVAANNTSGMAFVPKAGVLAQYATEARTALGLTAAPTDAQIQAYLESRYQGYVAAIRVRADADYAALMAKGAVDNGRFVVNSSQLAGLANTMLPSADATQFTRLAAARGTGDTFSLANVDAVYADGRSFRQVAAEALDTDLSGTANNQRVQEYWAARYNGLAQAIQSGADNQYRNMAANQVATRENFSVTNATSNAAEGVYAGVAGGSVTVGSLAIDAISGVSIANMANGVGVAGVAVGGGAALTYSESNATVSAYAAGNINAGAIAVNALARDGSAGAAASSEAFAGAGGLMAGIGAAVAISTGNNNVSATLGGTLTGRSGSSAVLANAMDTTRLSSYAVGATIGGGAAVGASVATSTKSSKVDATGVDGSRVTGWNNVSISAGTAGALSSKAIAGAGGIGAAASGAIAQSIGSEKVTASIGNNATVSATSVDVMATAMPKLSSESLGIAAAAGVAIGVSKADSKSSAEVRAYVGNDVSVSGGALTISASMLLPTSGDTAWSRAVAGTGGGLVGANATIATSTNTSTVEAYGGQRLRMPNGDVSISAVNDSRQRSEATGIAAGYIAAGATRAESSSSGSSKAWLERDAITQSNRTGQISVSAEGITENKANSTAGSGGVFAGAAALASTSDKTVTLAEIRSGSPAYTLYTAGLTLKAEHESRFNGNADSFQASVVGASGADARNVVDTTVDANIGAGIVINSLDNVFITATSLTGQTGGGARAGSGGVVGASAAFSDTKVKNTTTVNIGQGAVISLNGDPTTADVKLNIEAFNQLSTGDTVAVDAGGFFAGGGGRSDLDATIRNAINIGQNAILFSVGALQVGTASVNTSSNNANASLYGVVTGAGASTYSKIDVGQTITLGNNVTLEAFGNLTLTAGQSGNGLSGSLVAAKARTEVYNYALIPITAQYRGSAVANSNSNLTVGTGGKLLAGRNILVGAYKGSVTAEGRGTNHNPYLAMFNTTTSDDNSDTNTSANAVLNGTIYAGTHNSQNVTIGMDGSVTLAAQDYPFAFTEVAAGDVATSFVSYNDRKLRYDIANTYNPYADIVTKIMQLTGLNEADTRWRLATRNDIFYGVTISADARRQVETFVNQIRTGSVPDRMVGTVAIGSIMASAGDVEIHADTLSGSANVTAKGAPRIDIVNNGRGYVLLNKLLLTSNEGGHVDFTGAAAASSANGLRISTDTGPDKPEISVRSTWGGDVDHLGNVTIPSVTPDIYFLGDVQNLNGAVTVRNAIGNVTILGNSFSAATIDMQVPRGNLTVNQGAGSIYETNNDVMAQWRGNQYRPLSAAQAVQAVATYMEGWANIDRQGNPTDNNSFTARTLVKNYQDSIYPHGLISNVWFKVYPDNIGSQNSQTGVVGDFREGYFRWTVWNGDGDRSGPFGWLKFDVIQRQALTYEANNASIPLDTTPQIIGGSIILSAGTINVNGTIQSGFSNAWSVNVGTAAANTIAYYKNDAAVRAANAGRFIELPVSAINGSLDTTIRAYYDVSNDRIELQNVVQGAGGRVYLNGGIISTSTVAGQSQGLIRVNGGYATVNVVNTTGTSLVTNTINTGTSTSSVVEIVDQYKWANGAPIRTWYVYDVSQANALSVYEQTNGSNNTDYRNARLVTASNGQTASYNPHENLLYQWVETATAVRQATPNSHVQLGEWQWESNLADPYTTTRSVYIGTQSTNFREVVTGTASYSVRVDMPQNHQNGTDFHGYWVQNVYDRATITLTNTVRASNPINIQFIGGSNGQVSVSSNSTVQINGTITNYNGATSISATGSTSAVIASRDGSVSGRSVTINGEGGIGTAAQAVGVQVYGGTLTASSTNRDINISARGDLNVASVRVNGRNGQALTAGDVTLTASGDITSASAYNVANPIIVGKSVSINSASGAIGARSGSVNGQPALTNINPIVFQASGVRLANGSLDGGVLDSRSSTGAYLVQSQGDLRIGHVSSDGAVFLAAAGSNGQAANIVPGSSRTGLSVEESARLQNIWTSLDLLRQAQQDGTVGADGSLNTSVYAGSAAVHGYEAMVNRAYEDYWQLRTIAFADGQTYALTDAGRVALKAQIAAERGVAASQVLESDVEAEARRRFATARSILGLDQTVNASYDAYWQLRDMAFADGTTYAITTQGSQFFRSELATRLNVDPGTITDAQIETEARSRFATARANLGRSSDGQVLDLPQNQLEAFRVAPTTAILTSGLSAYTQGFSYKLGETTALYASLTSGARWTLDQLTYTIDASANPASNTPLPTIGQLPQNVSARQVMLYAPNGSIGSLAAPRTIVFSSDNLGALSEADRATISAAGPGELQVSTRTLSNGATQYTVQVAQQDLVIASPLGTIAAKAKSEIYLGSASNLKLGGVDQGLFPGGVLAAAYTQGVQTTHGGTVRLEAIGDIVGGVTGQVAISGNISNLTIISETGSIGLAGVDGSNPADNLNALQIALTGSNIGTLNLAQAARGIYLRQTTGDLILGNISGGSGSRAAVQLGATGSIYAQAQFTDRTVPHILGSTLDLRAGGSISFRNGTFQPLQIAITGAVTGHAGGDFSLLSPTQGVTTGRDGAYGTLTAGGNIVVNSTGGALTLSRSLQSAGNLTLVASGLLTLADSGDDGAVTASANAGDVVVTAGTLGMGAGTRILAGGTVSILTTGNALIGQVESTSAGHGTVPAIQITAGSSGSIIGNGDLVTNIKTTSLGGVVLNAGQAIDLDVSTGWLNATAGNGDLVIDTTGGLTSTALASTGGSVKITAGGTLALGSVASRMDTRLVSLGGAVRFLTVTADRDAALEAASDIEGTSVIADGSISATSGGLIDIATLRSGRSMGLNAGSRIQATTVDAGTSATLDAVSDIGATDLTTGTFATVRAGGLVDIDTLAIGTVLTSTAGTTTTFAAVGAGTSIDVTSAGLIDIASATTTTGNIGMTSTGGSIRIGSLDAGNDAVLNTFGDVRGTSAVADGSISATSGGLIDIATLRSGRSVGLNAGSRIQARTVNAGTSATLDAVSDVQATDLTTGTFATLRAGGLIYISTLDIGTVLTSTAGTTTTFGTLGAGTSMDVTSTGLIDITSATTGTGNIGISSTGGSIGFGTLDAGNDVVLNAFGDVRGTSAVADGSISATAGGLIDISTLDIGTVLTTTAGTTTTFGTVGAGTSMDVTSTGLIDITSATTTTGDIRLTSSAGSMRFGSLGAGNDTMLNAFGDVRGTSAVADGSLSATSGGLIDIATLGTGGSVGLNAGSRIQATTIEAGTSATLDAVSDIRATDLTTGTFATLRAGGLIGIDTLDIGTVLTTTAGTTTTFDTVGAGTSMDVTSAGLIDISSATTGADNIGLTSTGGSIRFGSLDAGNDAVLNAFDDIRGTSAVADGSINATAGGLIDIANLSTGGSVGLNAGSRIQATTINAGTSATLDAVSDIQATDLTTGTFATLRAGGLIGIDTLDIGTVLTSTAGTTTTFDTVGAGTSMDVTSAGLIDISSATTGTGNIGMTSTGGSIRFGSFDAGNDAVLNAFGDIRGTSAVADGSINAATGGLIDVATLRSGRSVGLNAGSGIQFTALNAGTSATLDALSDIRATDLTTGTFATLRAGGLIDIQTLDIATVLTTTAGTTTTFGTVGAGTSMDVTSTGLIDIASATTGTGDIRMASTGGSIRLGTLDAGNDALLNAFGDLNARSVTAAGALRARAGGEIQLGSIGVGSSLVLYAGTFISASTIEVPVAAELDAALDITVGSLRTGTSATLRAGRAISVGNLDIGTVLASSAGTSTTLGTAQAAAMDVVSGGLLDITSATSRTGSIRLASTGASILIDRLTSERDATLQAQGGIDANELLVEGALQARAGGLLDLGTATADGALEFYAGSLTATNLSAGTDATLDVVGDLRISILATGGAANIAAGGALGADRLDVGTALSGRAGGAMTIATAQTGTSAALSAGGLLSVNSLETVAGDARLASTGGSIILDRLVSSRSAFIDAFGSLDADDIQVVEDMTATAGGQMAVGNAEAGGSISLTAGTMLNATQIRAGRALALSAGTDLRAATLESQSATVLAAGANIDVAALDVGTVLTTRAGSSTLFGRVAAGSSLDIQSGGLVQISGAVAGDGDSSLTSSGGAIQLGSLQAGGALTLAAASELRAQELRAGGNLALSAAVVSINNGRAANLSISAGRQIEAEQLSASDRLALSVDGGGSIRLGRAQAVRLAIFGASQFDANELAVQNDATLAADNIRITNLAHAGSTGPLALDVTGAGGADAQTLQAFLTTPRGVAIGDYRVATSSLRTSGSFVSIARGVVTNTMTLNTSMRDIFMNNRSPVPVNGFDVQLFQPDYRFKLVQEGMRTTTDAFYVQFGPGSETYFERNGLLYAGMSMSRDINLALQSAGSGGDEDETGAGSGMTGPTAAALLDFLAQQTRPALAVDPNSGPGPAVRLDNTVTNPIR